MNKKDLDFLMNFFKEKEIDLDSKKAVYITKKYQEVIKSRR